MTRAVVWFRRDLSLADNPAFLAATTFDEVACAWVLEPSLLGNADLFRRTHVLAAVRSLADDLARRGGHLAVLAGPATEAIPRFTDLIGARDVFWNGDVTAFAQFRDGAVRDLLQRNGISVITSWGTLMQPPRSVLTAAGTVPHVFKRFHDLWRGLPLPLTPPGGPASLLDVAGDATLPVVPASAFDAGESGARGRLAKFVTVVDDYETARDRLDLDGTSRLSADLRFGTITPHQVAVVIGTTTPGRRAFVRQLAWRDWYAHLFFERPDLAVMPQHAAYQAIDWRNDPREIESWREGRTGYPIVDAAMRELAASGWLHNRLRMIVASFLVKDLLVDWRVGERYFRRLLVDGDIPQNAGNWQWSAGTGHDAAPYFRIMNPTTQGRRFDPNGDYVRRWLPELANLGAPGVHEPGELDASELAAGGVVLGENYPFRIVEHSVARVRALDAYSAARRQWSANETV